MREYNAIVGATDGNIIAAIITTQTPRNQPSLPSPVHGPLSMPRICSAVHHQPMPARVSSIATRPSRRRAAAKAGVTSPPRPGRVAISRTVGSGGPGEVRGRQACLALVLDAEGIDPRALSLGHREIRSHGMEHSGKPHGLAGLDTEGHDVLDFEVDH